MHIRRIQINVNRFPTRERYPFSLAYEETDHYRVYRDFMADPHDYTTDTNPGKERPC